jgi:hypothetical protein
VLRLHRNYACNYGTRNYAFCYTQTLVPPPPREENPVPPSVRDDSALYGPHSAPCASGPPRGLRTVPFAAAAGPGSSRASRLPSGEGNRPFNKSPINKKDSTDGRWQYSYLLKQLTIPHIIVCLCTAGFTACGCPLCPCPHPRYPISRPRRRGCCL